jgi:hypothetical protein
MGLKVDIAVVSSCLDAVDLRGGDISAGRVATLAVFRIDIFCLVISRLKFCVYPPLRICHQT